MTLINSQIGVEKRNGIVYYFNGCFPFYSHREGNRNSFKNIVCQMLSNGRATREEISKAFKIPARSISRWMVVYDKEGDGCFFSKKNLPASASSLPK